MKTSKDELVYCMVLLASILLIYISFQTAFADVTLSQIAEKRNVFFLSFDSYIYLVVGLILFSFTAYLYMHLGTYKVGKLFAVYMTFISTSICLAAATNYQYSMGNMFIVIFSFISNIFLFYVIGYITLLTHKKFFKLSVIILCITTVIFIILYVISMNTDNMVLIILKDEIVLVDYILTIIVTIISMLKGYKGSTVYSKRQISFLSVGLLFGIFIFITMRLMPIMAVVKVPESNEEMAVKYQMNIVGSNQDIYPIMVFTGITIVLIYLLIKREYLAIDENHDLWCYLLSSIYLILGNTYFLLITYAGQKEFLAFNSILITPLILLNHRIWKKRENSYDNNFIEVLEEERQRISVLLHDEVLQDLIALSHSIKEEDIKERLSMVIGDIRCISQDLYPTIVEDLGLEQALHIFIDEICVDYNLDINYKYDYPKGILPKGISLVLYRTVKELVTNAIKHSHCRNIFIRIVNVTGGMECSVTDDGCGFQLPEKMELLKSPHMGLYTVKKQIADLNGNIRIFSDKSGSKFQIFIPLK